MAARRDRRRELNARALESSTARTLDMYMPFAAVASVTESASSSAPAPYVVLGVMSNPVKPLLREQWREWESTFKAAGTAVRVRYVFGKTVYQQHDDQGPSTAELPTVKSEVKPSGESDHIFVAGRERLPNVGVVTEKSAYFWQTATSIDATARWFCKCDDDTLVHLDRLADTLRYVRPASQRTGPRTRRSPLLLPVDTPRLPPPRSD